MEIKNLVAEIYENAVKHGWYDDQADIPTLLCMVHAEVSEALEAHCNHDLDNFAEELADIVIMVFSMSGELGIDIEKEITQKNQFNKKRPYRHGNKAC